MSTTMTGGRLAGGACAVGGLLHEGMLEGVLRVGRGAAAED
jgi:hypothetical protein